MTDGTVFARPKTKISLASEHVHQIAAEAEHELSHFLKIYVTISSSKFVCMFLVFLRFATYPFSTCEHLIKV